MNLLENVSLLVKPEKLDWGSILDNKSDRHATEGEVGRNEYLFSGDFSGEIAYFEGDMRNSTHKFRDRRFRPDPTRSLKPMGPFYSLELGEPGTRTGAVCSIQPTSGITDPTRCSIDVTVVTLCSPCVQKLKSYMLKNTRREKHEMLQLTNCEDSRHRSWCAVLVLFAVCALTVSVATRYAFSRGASFGSATAVHKHSSPEPSRQRLMKNAATWMPPVVCSTVFQAPSSYPSIAPAAPPIPALFFEENLYNRPPPYSHFLS